MVIANLLRKKLHALSMLSQRPQEARKKRWCTAGGGVRLYPECRIGNMQADAGAISIGSNSQIRGQLVVFPHGGRIQIGHFCFVGEDSRIWSGANIVIGDRVLVSHGVNIHDTVSHSISASRRHEHFQQIVTAGFPSTLEEVPAQAPIAIEDDAWLGFNSSVLRGVTIGRGAIVGAASVVTKDVAPFSIVVGNPARVVGEAKP